MCAWLFVACFTLQTVAELNIQKSLCEEKSSVAAQLEAELHEKTVLTEKLSKTVSESEQHLEETKKILKEESDNKLMALQSQLDELKKVSVRTELTKLD